MHHIIHRRLPEARFLKSVKVSMDVHLGKEGNAWKFVGGMGESRRGRVPAFDVAVWAVLGGVFGFVSFSIGIACLGLFFRSCSSSFLNF